MELEFSGEVIHWRGPAPYFFVAVPDGPAADIQAVSAQFTYGWGVIPVRVVLGGTTWTTSLFPKDDGYLVPLKAKVRTAETVAEGEMVALRMTLGR
jgi:hypothetical protein